MTVTPHTARTDPPADRRDENASGKFTLAATRRMLDAFDQDRLRQIKKAKGSTAHLSADARAGRGRKTQ